MLSPSWLSYLFTGVMTLFASWAMSGCRFGNQTVEAPQVQDLVSGIYETQPQSLVYCANDNNCANTPTNLIPAEFTEILTNPVVLRVTDPAAGRAILFSPFGGEYGIPIFVNPDQTLSVLRTSGRTTVWNDPACTRQDQELIEGRYTKTSGPWTSNTPELTKDGRIEMTITYVTSFDGDCAASIQAVAACYADSAQCGTHDAESVRALYAPFVNSGAITAAEISTTTTLAYEISYQ
ncbi:MAG TPA: hypothetical protein VM598_07180 [Bdellovibrionota bacterium]|nr:hypothetical protein [Bdellovibrionota bacterium]